MVTPRQPATLDDPAAKVRGRPRARRAIIVGGDFAGSLGAMGGTEAVAEFTDHELLVARTAVALSITGLTANLATAISELTAIDLERSRRGDATGARLASTLTRIGRSVVNQLNQGVTDGGGTRLTVVPLASSRRADSLSVVLGLSDGDDELQDELARDDDEETTDA